MNDPDGPGRRNDAGPLRGELGERDDPPASAPDAEPGLPDGTGPPAARPVAQPRGTDATMPPEERPAAEPRDDPPAAAGASERTPARPQPPPWAPPPSTPPSWPPPDRPGPLPRRRSMPPLATGYAVARLPIRAAATLLDWAILGVAWIVALSVFLAILEATGRLDPATVGMPDLSSMTMTDQQFALGLSAAAILWGLSGFYHVYAWARLRATPGQQACRLLVVDGDNGRPLSPARAAIRWFVGELPVVGLLFGVVMLVWFAVLAVSVAIDPNARGIHDLAARSVVIRQPPRGTAGEGG